jgi:hypothetical protein
MKKTLLLTTALASGLLVTAQTQRSNHLTMRNGTDKHITLLNSLLNINLAPAQKPTGTAQRVIAQVYNETGYADSTRFKYTGTRGSSYEHNVLNFGYNMYYGSNYPPIFTSSYQNDPSKMLADSIISYEDTVVYHVSKGYYRNDNKLDSFTSTSISSPNPDYVERNLHTFYPGGYLKEATSLYDDGTTSGINQIRRLTYSSNYDRVMTDTLLADDGASGVEPFVVTEYHYNAQGKPDTVTTLFNFGTDFIPFSKAVIGYTADQKVRTIRTYDVAPNSSQLSLYQTDTFAYANNSTYFTFWENTTLDEDGNLSDGQRWIKNVGTNGLPDSINIYSNDGTAWSEQITLHYTYNSFSNPVTLNATMGGAPEDGMITFYYETYDDGQVNSIKPVAENKDFTVYPNPFSNNISIDWKGKAQNNVTVSLTNIVGQEVFKTELKLNAGQNTIALPALTSGNYILLLQDANGKSWSNKMVKR